MRPQDDKTVRMTGRSERQFCLDGRLAAEEPAQDVVAVRGGSPVHLRDLGTVIDGSADKRTAAMLDGQSTVALDIQ